MTQPSTVNQTFDTSLVDVQKSFSSTETNTSASSGKENLPPTGQASASASQRPSSPWHEVSTDVLYDQWANTYDTDGNVLQAVDDIQLHRMLPEFVQLTEQRRSSDALRILDLGCGTGRNTLKLLQSSWNGAVDVTGWDGSPAMLELARMKCETALSGRGDKADVGIELEEVDLMQPDEIVHRSTGCFDGLISTLVLEHIELRTYFAIVAAVLKPGSVALITTMHADMGATSRAGYKTATGERFKATSYVYSVEETVTAAREVGLEVVGEAREMAVDERMLDGGIVDGVRIERGTIAERARKWIGTKIWYGMMLRKR